MSVLEAFNFPGKGNEDRTDRKQIQKNSNVGASSQMVVSFFLTLDIFENTCFY